MPPSRTTRRPSPKRRASARRRATSRPSGPGCSPRPTQRAAALLADGRARLDAEVAELEAKADADIVLLGSRTVDEMRAEIARLSALAAERLVEDSLDDATQQRLIEEFIAEVGATTPADHGARA